MNGKLFSKMVFYMVGTFIILIFGFIMISNFSKDARLFAKPVTGAEETSGLKVPDMPQDDAADANKTIKYTRAADAKGSQTDFGESLPNSKKFTSTSTGGDGLKVDIANYTGLENIADELKITLEASGFDVSVENYKEDKNEKTIIIERNSKKAGLEVQKILKAGKIITAIDPKSKVDVTLVVGYDYRP